MESKKSSLHEDGQCLISCEAMGTSSVHSLSRLSQSKSSYNQVFWVAVFVVSVCGCVYQVNSFLQVYFQYPVLTDLEVHRGKATEFPAVTVCNLNIIAANAIDCVENNLTWFQCHAGSPWYRADTPWYQKVLGGTPPDRPIVPMTGATSTYNTAAKNLLSRYFKLDDNTRRCYGHSLEDLIQRCSFNSVACDSKDFAYFYSKQYGNCLTFNRQTEKDINTKHRIVKRTGPQSGLELALEAELSYYSTLTPSAGFRVVIHSPQEDPHPYKEGVNIPVGGESHLSVVKSSVHRLPSPYRDACQNYPPNGELNCVYECMQRVSMELCGCVDPFLAARPKTVPCNLMNETQTACMSRVSDLLSSKAERCDCPLSCFSTAYDVLLQSMATNWTGQKYFSDDNGQFGRYYDPRVCWSSIPHADRSETTLKVFFRTLEHTTYAQRPMYSDSEFFSHLGGQMSLWLGLSFISFYEFSEKLFILMISRRALLRRFSEY